MSGVRRSCASSLRNRTRASSCRRRRRMALSEEARLQDISVGGASFVCDAALDAGVRIVVQLMDADGELRLAGRVLRRRELAGTSVRKFRTSVEFPALSATEERRLGRFVSASQQQLMRKMTERAAAQTESVALQLTESKEVATTQNPRNPAAADRYNRSALSV